jgi:glycosyltransferase involved in cell wall biosynthesis
MRLELLIPTLRRPNLIRGALESVARADVPARMQVSVTVINNDTTAELPGLDQVLRSMRFPTALLHEPRPGKSVALNTAVARSTADVLGFVDDDEELDRRWFRIAEDALQAETVDFIGGRSLPMWRESIPAWVPAEYPAVLGIADAGTEPRAYGPGFSAMLTGGNAVIRRALLERIGPFSPVLGPRAERRLFSCEDEDMYLRLVDAGARGRYVPELVVYHHVHPERLRKSYYRAWCFWNGASKGVLSRGRRPGVPTIAGVPRYVVGEAARGAMTWLRTTVAGGPADRHLSAELPLWQLAGRLYGRHFPHAAARDKARPRSGQPRNDTGSATAYDIRG